LNYTEDEIMAMTFRKFYLMYDQYEEMTGKKKRPTGIDDLP
jgi:hypothetical protein